MAECTALCKDVVRFFSATALALGIRLHHPVHGLISHWRRWDFATVSRMSPAVQESAATIMSATASTAEGSFAT